MVIELINSSGRTIARGPSVLHAIGAIRNDDYPRTAVMYNGPEGGYPMIDRELLRRNGVRKFLITINNNVYPED